MSNTIIFGGVTICVECQGVLDDEGKVLRELHDEEVDWLETCVEPYDPERLDNFLQNHNIYLDYCTDCGI